MTSLELGYFSLIITHIILSSIPLDDYHSLSPEEHEKWRRHAVNISILTVVLLVFLGTTFTVLAFKTNSSAALGLAADMMLDSMTSVVVLWRYFSKDNVKCKRKEQRAAVIIGAIFILCSMIILSKSIYTMVMKETTSEIILCVLSGLAAVAMTIIATFKFIIARKLNSRSVLSDAFSSALAALISYSIVIGSIISLNFNVSSTTVDSSIGILISPLLAGWGIWMWTSGANASTTVM
ncbi:transmembrane protein 163a-like [Glandiceps talaboti]